MIEYWKIAVVVGIFIIIILLLTKKRKPYICEKDIYHHRKNIRELDSFLSDMQEYFKKVEEIRRK